MYYHITILKLPFSSISCKLINHLITYVLSFTLEQQYNNIGNESIFQYLSRVYFICKFKQTNLSVFYGSHGHGSMSFPLCNNGENLRTAINNNSLMRGKEQSNNGVRFSRIQYGNTTIIPPIYVPLLDTCLLSQEEGLSCSSNAGPVLIGNCTHIF